MDAVLIELEGIVVETAAARRDALRRTLADEGIVLPTLALETLPRALPAREAVRIAAAQANAALDDTALDLAALRIDRDVALWAEGGVTLRAGARAWLEAVAAKAPLAIVTRAPRRLVDAVLALAEVEALVAVAVTADDALAPKPDPASYERALGRLGRRRPLRAGRCVALEDGVAGIGAARASGVRAVAVGRFAAEEALLADAVAASLDDATPEFLARVASRGEAAA